MPLVVGPGPMGVRPWRHCERPYLHCERPRSHCERPCCYCKRPYFHSRGLMRIVRCLGCITIGRLIMQKGLWCGRLIVKTPPRPQNGGQPSPPLQPGRLRQLQTPPRRHDVFQPRLTSLFRLTTCSPPRGRISTYSFTSPSRSSCFPNGFLTFALF